MSDFRYAIRSLLHAPAFGIGAILTFALGIGVNVAVFSAVDRMLFRALPYADPGGLVVMGNYTPDGTTMYGTVAAQEVVEARRLPAVAEVATTSWNADRYRLDSNPDGASYLNFVECSYTMLGVLGVRPLVGQDFTEADARDKRHRLMITYRVWKERFDGRADVVGRRLWGWTPDTTGEIVGVLPPDFIPPQVTLPDLGWSGLSVSDDTFGQAGPRERSTPPVVRLRPGVSAREAQTQLDTAVARLRAEQGLQRSTAPTRLAPLRQALFGRYTTYLALVFAAATLVLLVGCANLASLLFVRARAREHQAAVRRALGASAGRIVRTAIAEATLLSLGGSVLALVVLKAADRALVSWLPAVFSAYTAPVFASRVLIFSVLLATTSAIVAGVLPGLRSARVDVMAMLQRGGRSGSGPLRGGATVLTAEIALSVVLVACAAITGRSLVGLIRTGVGFDPNRLVTITTVLPDLKEPERNRQQYGQALDVLRTMPGVQSASGANVLPMIGAVSMPMWKGDQQGQRWLVADGFVETMGMRLLAGRGISPADVRSGASVGLLSERGLKLVWPGVEPRDAIGRVLQFAGEPPRQVIGVVSDVRDSYDSQPFPSLYTPLDAERFRWMMYVARTVPGRTIAAADVTHTLEQHGLAATRVTVSRVLNRLERGMVNHKFRAELFLSFGLVALVLASIGLYAVQSFSVATRQSEFGIRISLGAEPRHLWRLLIRQTLRPVVAGIVVGVVVSYWAARFLQSFVVGVDARDPWTLVGVVVVLASAALASVWLPARRAASVDPLVALRAD